MALDFVYNLFNAEYVCFTLIADNLHCGFMMALSKFDHEILRHQPKDISRIPMFLQGRLLPV